MISCCGKRGPLPQGGFLIEILLTIGFVSAIITGAIANSKGRAPLKWGVFGLCLPVIALIAVAIVDDYIPPGSGTATPTSPTTPIRHPTRPRPKTGGLHEPLDPPCLDSDHGGGTASHTRDGQRQSNSQLLGRHLLATGTRLLVQGRGAHKRFLAGWQVAPRCLALRLGKPCTTTSCHLTA